MRRAANQQFQCLSHGGNIGSDIDRISHQQQADDAIQQPRGIVTADIGSQAMTADAADFRTDHLDANHQWIGQKQRP